MRKTLSGLFILATLSACSPTPHHDTPCHGKAAPAAAKHHKMPCHCPKGFCPHDKHGSAPKDYDVKHNAEWHNSHAN